jgi:IS1 family transposase
LWVLSFALLLVLVLVNLNSLVKIENQDVELAFSKHSFSSLIDFLQERDIGMVYTGYMHCYKLVFESGEEILASPDAGPVKLDRYPAYASEVDSAERIAVVFNHSYTESIETMESALAEQGITYRRDDFENYVIFWDFSERPDIDSLGLPEGLMSGTW